jgi:DNA-binding beta-propeller fold protein YncE
LVVVLLLLVLLVCAFMPALSLGSVGHRYAGQFSSGGGAPGEVSSPLGVAVRQSSGDVLVLDSGNGRVERFDAAGEFLALFDGSGTPAAGFAFPDGIAVDQASGDVYVADTGNNVVDVFSAAGGYLRQLEGAATPALMFSSPGGVAVDPGNGDVYVSDTGDNVVDVFDNTGAFVTSFDGSSAGDGPFVGPAGVAVDAAHAVYVLDSGKARVEKYTALGAAFTSVFDSVSPAGLAVDPASGEVYVGENGPSGFQVSEFASSGAAVSTFGPPHVAGATGLGVSSATGTLYVADEFNNAIMRFAAFLTPTVTTEAASGVSATEATVAGTINPEGVAGATTYHFDYGTSTSYGASTEPVDTGGGSSDVPASATLTGLQPGTTYHYRLVGTNASGSSVGADETFTTNAAQAAVDVQPSFASVVTTTTASLNATVNPNGADTTYHFEYGTSTSYGTSTPDADAGSATGETPVTAPITGLALGTTYHYRVVADNGIGSPAQSADAEFTTAPGTPPNASEVLSTSAKLNATVIPGIPAPFTGNSYHFEYGTSTSYGTKTTETLLPEVTHEVLVSVPISRLTPGTTYHFRVVMTTGATGQTVTSNDATFTTIAVPTVSTLPATGVTPTSATLNATVDTHGSAGTFTFAVTSPDSAYATTTSAASLTATNGPQSISVTVSNLPPSAEYLVQASASVADATTWGEQAVFSTPELPPFNPPTPPPAISANPYAGLPSPVAAPAVPLPSNAFTIAKIAVQGATATLTVKVPGPGKLETTGKNSAPTGKTIRKSGTVRLTIHLNKAGRKALAKARRRKLTIALRITYTPDGGKAAGKTQTITLEHGGTR